MANTEGMSDEAMASLLSRPPDDGTGTTTTTGGSSRFTRLSLRRRMELPMGGRPAATVIRRSNPRHVNCVIDEKKESSTEPQEAAPMNERAPQRPPPFLGGVVERSVDSLTTPDDRNQNGQSGSRSYFSAQRNPQHLSRLPALGGFPSVDMPLGTFVKHCEPSGPARALPVTRSIRQEPSTDVLTAQQSASRNDAQAMLKRMTPQEIEESVQELRESLSPDSLTFLRDRQKKRVESSKKVDAKVSRMSGPTSAVDKIVMPRREADEAQEKERVARLLASIRNYDDMDAAYAAEANGTPTKSNSGSVREEDDWDIACELLRSTNPRQALWAAQVVCERLESEVRDGKSYYQRGTADWPYRTILPVSLRCLLDAPLAGSTRFLLHTFALRALYALLRLGAHPDHAIDVAGEVDTPTSICQEYFLCDAVLTPQVGTCYRSIAPEQVVSGDDGKAMAYVASSAYASAPKDGLAFTKDPMWTLLSRMKILPLLARLLNNVKPDSRLPEEGTAAMCGILAMLCVRSPGAASAIVRHSTLLPTLLKATVMPPSGDTDTCRPNCLNPRRMLPALILSCTLARQSRLAASSLPVDEVLLPLLAMKLESAQELRVHRWGIILWRTVLRYGLGLTHLQTFISMSIPHLTVSQSEEFSLVTEYSSTFAVILQCVKVVARGDRTVDRRVISEADEETISMALTWLEDAVVQTVRHCRETSGLHPYRRDGSSEMRAWAGKLHLLHAYASTLEQIEAANGTVPATVEEHAQRWESLVASVESMMESGLVSQALSVIPQCRFLTTDSSDCDTGRISGTPPTVEAAACALLDALASLFVVLVRTSRVNSRDRINAVAMCFNTAVIQWLQPPCNKALPSVIQTTSRVGWLNKTYSAICRSLIATLPSLQDRDIVPVDLRSAAFTLLARLLPGEEATAAVLLSSDCLFRPKSLLGEEAEVSSLFMKALCAGEGARAQLDHSFKLQSGLGVTTNGWGAFKIDSLLSESDAHMCRHDPITLALLPIGKLWIWKALASQYDDAANVSLCVPGLSSCLDLLLQLENDAISSDTAFAAIVPRGAKLYYLFNVCLQPESALQDNYGSSLVHSLYSMYKATDHTSAVGLVRSFSVACLEHSHTAQESLSRDKSSQTRKEDERMLREFIRDESSSKRELSALNNFVIDMCTAYNEYGAQYEVFTKCIRLFLGASFPELIRCEALKRLSDVAHLLTLQAEADDICGLLMQKTLEEVLVGDHVCGTLHRDPPEVLDIISFIVKRDAFPREGFFYFFAVASLAQSLLVGILRVSSSSAAPSRRRLQGLDCRTVDLVVDISKRLSRSREADAIVLARATLEACMADRLMLDRLSRPTEATLDDSTWDTIVSELRQSPMSSRP